MPSPVWMMTSLPLEGVENTSAWFTVELFFHPSKRPSITHGGAFLLVFKYRDEGIQDLLNNLGRRLFNERCAPSRPKRAHERLAAARQSSQADFENYRLIAVV